MCHDLRRHLAPARLPPSLARAAAVALLCAAAMPDDAVAQRSSREKQGIARPADAAQAPPEAPSRGRYRVFLSGFRVVQETSDHILEADGKRDEVFLMAEVWEMRRDGTPRAPRRSLRTHVLGDVNNQNNPRRHQAGSASPDGGLRSGDPFPWEEPWNNRDTFRPQSVPLLLWEGELVHKENTLVFMPTVWEWDGPNEVLAAWQQYIAGASPAGRGLLQMVRETPARLSEDPASILSSARSHRFQFWRGEGDNDRPIGMYGGGPRTPSFDPQLVAIDWAAAQRAIESPATDKGPGVIEVEYRDDFDRKGHYILYLRVERAD